MGRVKAGVVGVGKMGEYHVGVLAEMQKVELVGIVEPDENRGKAISKKYDVPHYSKYQDIFGKVDVVSIAVPTTMHYSIAKEFLSAGIHVLVEKPATNDLEQAKELFDLAAKKGLTLHIGHIERFNGAVQELFKVVVDPIFVECTRMSP